MGIAPLPVHRHRGSNKKRNRAHHHHHAKSPLHNAKSSRVRRFTLNHIDLLKRKHQPKLGERFSKALIKIVINVSWTILFWYKFSHLMCSCYGRVWLEEQGWPHYRSTFGQERGTWGLTRARAGPTAITVWNRTSLGLAELCRILALSIQHCSKSHKCVTKYRNHNFLWSSHFLSSLSSLLSLLSSLFLSPHNTILQKYSPRKPIYYDEELYNTNEKPNTRNHRLLFICSANHVLSSLIIKDAQKIDNFPLWCCFFTTVLSQILLWIKSKNSVRNNKFLNFYQRRSTLVYKFSFS